MPTRGEVRTELQRLSDAFGKPDVRLGRMTPFVADVKPKPGPAHQTLKLSEYLAGVDTAKVIRFERDLDELLSGPAVWKWKSGCGPQWDVLIVGRDEEGRWAGFRTWWNDR